MPDSELLNDDELRALLRIGKSTFYRLLADGPPNKSDGDIREIKHNRVGGVRRWVRSSVMAFVSGESPQRKEA